MTPTDQKRSVIALFKDFREFKEEDIQIWANSWLKLGPIVIQKLSQKTFIFHCILEDDKHFKFADTAIWARVEGILANVDQTSIALNILEKVGVCIFVDSHNTPDKLQRTIRVRLWIKLRKPLVPWVFLGLNNGTSKWVDIRYEGVFVFCKKCGMIGHKDNFCKTPTQKAKKKESVQSFQNFKQDKHQGYFDSSSSSSEEDNDDDPIEDDENEESNEENNEEDEYPNEDEGNNRGGDGGDNDNGNSSKERKGKKAL
ncbi:Halomucin [Bienertia sinuspersici]